MSEPTDKHIHILQHSLGLTNGKKEYRNHFVAGGKDVELCRENVAMGFMEEGRASDMTGGDPVFFVLDAGRELAKSRKVIP